MKKLFAVGLIALAPVFAKAQVNDSTVQQILKKQQVLENRMVRSGNELIKYKSIATEGIGLEAMGAILGVIGSINLSNAYNENQYNFVGQGEPQGVQPAKTLIYAGIGLSAIGFIVHLVAIDHIGKAGIRLKGNGIVIPIGK